MVERHFAFFRQGTGEYVREWKGPVDSPNIDPTLAGDARLAAMNDWATRVSQPRAGEIALDVTQFDYPVGDFCWARFDVVDRVLDFPTSHTFIQIDRATMTVHVNSKSPRPIRSTPERVIVDITGTRLEPFYGYLFGRVVRRDDQWVLEPTRDEAIVPAPAQWALEAARLDLAADLVTETARVRVLR